MYCIVVYFALHLQNQKLIIMKNKSIQSLILFLVGFTLFMSTRRSEIIPSFQFAILLSSILILRFIRVQSKLKGILLTFLGFLLSLNISLWGLFQMSDSSTMIIFNVIRSSLLAFLYTIPFTIDRIVYPKFLDRKFLSTLTFPIINTSIFFLSSLEGPFDGGTMLGKYAIGPSFFIQIDSLFGLCSFAFIISWIVSITNFAWENNFIWKKVRTVLLVFFSIFLPLLIYGVIKSTKLFTKESDSVKIAAAVILPENGSVVQMEQVYAKKITSPFESRIKRIEKLCKEASLNNAKIVTFQEFAITIMQENEQLLKDRFKNIAKENDIYLSITYAYFKTEGKGENKHLLIDNKGKILLNYTKRYLLGYGNYGENSAFIKGPEVIQSASTPYGKIGISICRDMSFPSFIRQAGKTNVDIMLSPSYDWPKSTGPSYRLRTIENGFSLIRSTYNGISYASDYNGAIIATMDSDRTDTGIMYAEVPTNGINTLYSRIGDILGWVCVTGLLIIIIIRKNHLKKA